MRNSSNDPHRSARVMSDWTAVETRSRSVTRCTLPSPLVRQWLARVPTLARRVTGVVAKFAKPPLLPYAALWEASILVGLVNGADRVDSESLPPQIPIHTEDGFLWRF
jgi:hypothetical protein